MSSLFAKKIFVLALLIVLPLSGTATAAPLNGGAGLELRPAPDTFSSFIDVAYDASTDALTADGFALELDADAIAGGTFDLDATVTDAGVLTSGSISIGGTIASQGFNSGTLLTGTLTEIGFPDAGGNPLEFFFSVTGGDAASLYGGIGARGGIILSAMGGTGFAGDWTADWSTGTSFLSTADVGTPIPSPTAASLGLGFLFMGGVVRPRRRRGAST